MGKGSSVGLIVSRDAGHGGSHHRCGAFRALSESHPSKMPLRESPVAKSLAAWGATGFTHVDEAAFSRRVSACRSCPHAKQAPETLAYRLAGAGKADPSMCGLCGCPIQRKARMSTESCPGEHPDKPG